MGELVDASAKRPQPTPRTRNPNREKPVEEMSVDELARAVEEGGEEVGREVRSNGDVIESTEEEQVDLKIVIRVVEIRLLYE